MNEIDNKIQNIIKEISNYKLEDIDEKIILECLKRIYNPFTMYRSRRNYE